MKSTTYGELTNTPIGPIGVIATNYGVRRVMFLIEGCNPTFDWRDDTFNNRLTEDGLKAFLYLTQALTEIHQYLAGDTASPSFGSDKGFGTALDLRGISAFQKAVLTKTAEIPFGKVRTYGEIALAVNRPDAARAVGSALAHNPIPLLIPCHRVIGSDARLHGFAAPEGIRIKAWLLALEGLKLEGDRVLNR